MKMHWLAFLIILIFILSYFSQGLNTLNPRTGVWTVAGNTNYTSETINVSGLISPVTVKIDSSGVAHIYAKTDHDLFFAQGYYMASNRLFQMEFQALLASGNLSKYIGAQGLKSDQTMHLIGLPQIAYMLQRAYILHHPEYYKYLQDFSAGINAYITHNTASLPLEFKLLGMVPFKWTPFDTLAWQAYMTWSLTTGVAEPLIATLLYTSLGFNETQAIWPYYPYYTVNRTVIPGDGTVNNYSLTVQGINPTYLWNLNWYGSWATGLSATTLHKVTTLVKDALYNITDPYSATIRNSLGSNSWVVTGAYSKSGYPILANDPHLPLLAPSVWIPMQLYDPHYNVTGWALAGVLGILIGHTRYTAWGLTTPEGNSANDYLEVLNGHTYLYNHTYLPMKMYNYTLLGKTYSIYYTNNGPLIARSGHYGISMNWAAATIPSYALIAELKLDRSKNISDMFNALKYWKTPPQNFALVSTRAAGYITAGAYPLIKETLPNHKTVYVIGSRALLNGTTFKFEPCKYVPFQYLPQSINPKRGFMLAPNQPTVSKNYPFPFIGGFWASGGRAETIYHFLKAHKNISITDFMALQSNVSDYWASMFVPVLLKALNGMSMNHSTLQAYKQLQAWNYTTYSNECGITIYWYLLAELYNLSIDKIYAQHKLLGIAPLPFVSSLIYLAKTDPQSIWFLGNFTKLVRVAFTKTITFLHEHFRSLSHWQWGNVHLLEIYSISRLRALSIGPVPIWGDSYTVSVGSVPFALQVPEPYVTVGSSLRTIASPGNMQFYGVFPGGPSENVLSYYYSNQLEHWLAHEYYNMNVQKTVVTIIYE